jgi:hypothetical protein
VYEIITGSAARYSLGARYNIAAHCSFDVSLELKQTEDQPKQFDREHILVFFRKFWIVSVGSV